MKAREFLIRCARAQGCGPALISRLFPSELSDASVASFLSHSKADYCDVFGITPKQSAALKAALADDEGYAQDMQWCAENDCSIVTIIDSQYPAFLAHMTLPPLVVWVQGTLPVSWQHACAIVGSRDATFYGKEAAKVVVEGVVAGGGITVSGGARGIDTVVHTYTLEQKGVTVVVPGCGLAHCYPAENKRLFEQIVASGGALISPFSPQTAPSKGLFPARNRVIAGLSAACVVAQAAQKSGALITASYAAEEGRDVGAVPGMITEPLFRGSNELIANGARIISDAGAVQELCKMTGVCHEVLASVEQGTSLSIQAQTVLSCIEKPRILDELCALTGYTADAMHEVLFELLSLGYIEQDQSGEWIRCG
jgi:DNA processing protein